MSQENALPRPQVKKAKAHPPFTYTFRVTLPENDKARLYALILEVHDKAGNVGYARRLLLLDKSSSVELKRSSSLRFTNANPK